MFLSSYLLHLLSYMLSGILHMGYTQKALLMYQGPNQIPAAVVLGQIPQERDLANFPTGTYLPLGHRYAGIV